MKKIFSISVENRSGVLSKVAGLFSRRSYNIDSLTVGETYDKTVSSMTICSSGTKEELEQIEKQLNKKLDVIKVRTFSESQAVLREVVLIKIKYGPSDRKEIMEICDMLKAEIVDTSANFLIIHMCDTPERVCSLLELLRKYSVTEISRTGTLAMLKCSE